MSRQAPFATADEFFANRDFVDGPVSRAAAMEICGHLADYGYQLIGCEGGIYRPDTKTFQPNIEWSWTRNPSAKTAAEAHEINLQAIKSMNEDPPECNVYYLVCVNFVLLIV